MEVINLIKGKSENIREVQYNNYHQFDEKRLNRKQISSEYSK